MPAEDVGSFVYGGFRYTISCEPEPDAGHHRCGGETVRHHVAETVDVMRNEIGLQKDRMRPEESEKPTVHVIQITILDEEGNFRKGDFNVYPTPFASNLKGLLIESTKTESWPFDKQEIDEAIERIRGLVEHMPYEFAIDEFVYTHEEWLVREEMIL